MALRTSDLLQPVQPSLQLDVDSLFRYCCDHVVAFPVSSRSTLAMFQFGHGQSNPTYLIEIGDGDLVKRYVLRKKPSGKLLQSAHAVEREFQVLQALGLYTQVPVPKVYCLCTDSSVIGTPFYIMEYLNGRIFMDPKLPGVAPARRNAIYKSIAKLLAALHSADVDAIGLAKFGQRDNYCKRQVERWAKQYVAATAEGKPEKNPQVFDLIMWLRNNVPAEDSSGAAGGIVHGDFRIDNLVFHPSEDRVIGILDWELSTLGNQMCDVAYSCLPYIVDATINNSDRHEGFEQAGLPKGIPPQADFLAEYCIAAGRPWPAAEWKFYIALSLFRLVSICTGIHNRWIMGNASGGERAQWAGKMALVLVDAARAVVAKESVIPERPPLFQVAHDQPEKFIVGGGDGTDGTGRFIPNKKVKELRSRVLKFMETHIYPMEKEFFKLAFSDSRWTVHPYEEKLQEMAKREGLWNMFIPFDSAARARKILFEGKEQVPSDNLLGLGLSNLEYGYLCEIMGRSVIAPQMFNCAAPDTGNMEVLMRYGNKEQLEEWLVPLLEGRIRSGFAMTEPQVASSDATNIECSIKREGDTYVINGTKWWTSGAMDPRCRILIVMGKTDFNAPKHKQQSMILVDIKTPGVQIKRPLMVFGFDDAPHGHAEVIFDNVRVPATNILLGEGRGFEIAQGRLGPGRLHHCMRLIGAAERGMQLMVERAMQRKTFGKLIAQHGSFQSDIAKCRIELESTRLLVLDAADQLDRVGNKEARGSLAMAKVAAPNMALHVIDTAIQVHGAAGVSTDFVLSHLWATARTLRIADGPDEVHLGTIAKLELRQAKL